MALTIKLDLTYAETTEVWLTMREQARRHEKFARSQHLPETFREDAARQAEQVEHIATMIHDAMVAQSGGE